MSSISVCIIAKDEQQNIKRAIESVSEIAGEVLLVDTGSTDRTRDIAGELGARVISYQWADDFGAARNFALEQAKSEWVFQLDADEALHAPVSRLDELVQHEQVDAFYFELLNLAQEGTVAGAISQRSNRLFRRDDWRYQGIIHETPVFRPEKSPMTAWSGLQILHWGYLPGPGQQAKGDRNRVLLEKAIRHDEKDFLLHYYLGDDFRRTGHLEAALQAFLQAERLCPGGARAHRALLALRICECLLETGEIKAAQKRVSREAKNFYDYRDLLFLAGRINEAAGELSVAAKFFERCLDMPSAAEKYLVAQEGLERIAAERAQQCRRP